MKCRTARNGKNAFRFRNLFSVAVKKKCYGYHILCKICPGGDEALSYAFVYLWAAQDNFARAQHEGYYCVDVMRVFFYCIMHQQSVKYVRHDYKAIKTMIYQDLRYIKYNIVYMYICIFVYGGWECWINFVIHRSETIAKDARESVGIRKKRIAIKTFFKGFISMKIYNG